MQSLTGLGGITSDWLPFRCICQLGSFTDVLLLRGKKSTNAFYMVTYLFN